MEEKDAPSLNEMRAFAYRLLGRREYSVFELGQRLRRKWPEARDIDVLVDALVVENLLSDERYAESFVRFRLQRFQGPLKIQAALRSKGVSDALVAQELGARSHEWSDIARQWVERQTTGPIDFDEKKKYYRRLVSRGFTHDQAMDALNPLTTL
ncbi:MAG: recombination regulator RecX [Xanthomonadales bacterium]|nr:recombination regulator RecX [Xanthomonadales bacterium]